MTTLHSRGPQRLRDVKYPFWGALSLSLVPVKSLTRMSSGCITGALVSQSWCVLVEGNTIYSLHLRRPAAFMTTHFLRLNSSSPPVHGQMKVQYYQYSHRNPKIFAGYTYLNSVTVSTRIFILSMTLEPRVVTIRHSFPVQKGTPILLIATCLSLGYLLSPMMIATTIRSSSLC